MVYRWRCCTKRPYRHCGVACQNQIRPVRISRRGGRLSSLLNAARPVDLMVTRHGDQVELRAEVLVLRHQVQVLDGRIKREATHVPGKAGPLGKPGFPPRLEPEAGPGVRWPGEHGRRAVHGAGGEL